MLSAFTSARAIDNIWSICLGVNLLRPCTFSVLYLASDAIEEYSLNNLKQLAVNRKAI